MGGGGVTIGPRTWMKSRTSWSSGIGWTDAWIDRWLAAALAEVSEAQRQVVLLRVVQGLSIAETAVALVKSQDAVKQLQRRGLSALKRVLQAKGDTSGASTASTGSNPMDAGRELVPRAGCPSLVARGCVDQPRNRSRSVQTAALAARVDGPESATATVDVLIGCFGGYSRCA